MLIESGIELEELETVYPETLTEDIEHVYPSLKKLTILDCTDCMYVTVNKVCPLIHSSDNKQKKLNIHPLPLPKSVNNPKTSKPLVFKFCWGSAYSLHPFNTCVSGICCLVTNYCMWMLPAHWTVIMDADIVKVSALLRNCAGFGIFHCMVQDSGVFREGCCTATTMTLTSIKQKW